MDTLIYVSVMIRYQCVRALVYCIPYRLDSYVDGPHSSDFATLELCDFDHNMINLLHLCGLDPSTYLNKVYDTLFVYDGHTIIEL